MRGAALLGLSVVNVPIIAGIDLLTPPLIVTDRFVAGLVALLFQGKFFVLFSFLFGWGFAIQRRSARCTGRRFGPVYGRRLAGLLSIGVAHALLVFTGDILVLYALLGVPLWLLRDTRPGLLLAIAMAFTCLASGVLAGLGLLLSEVDTSGASVLTGKLADSVGVRYLGSFVDVARQRLVAWPEDFGFVLAFNGPLAFAAFCAGLAAAKLDFLAPGSTIYQALRARWPWLLIAGGLLNGAYALAMVGMLGYGLPALLAFCALALGTPCLASIYLIAIVEIVRHSNKLQWLAIAGRMSLSAYVAAGVMAGFIFNGYGLGLYGQTGDLACLVIAVLIYIVVVLACVIWSRFMRQGPLELLLRAVTYGRVWGPAS